MSKSVPTPTTSLDDLDFRLVIDDVRGYSSTELDTVRFACQTNLRFLLNCVLRPPNPRKFPTLLENVHGKIIDSLLKPTPHQDLEDWSNLDEFVTLASRGMLKSTIGAGLLTQVILCAPDVRILIISGKLDKAESILATARDPFYTNEVLRFLFPEWAIEKEHIKVGEFTTPKRNPELNYRDATLETSSFDSVKAGGHHELILFDDATNEINSNNPTNCEKTHGQYDDTDPLVEPGGYRIFLGTKWLDEDLPEYIRQKGLIEHEKTGQPTMSYFFLPAWTLREDGTAAEIEQRKRREKQGSLEPEDVILTWPEKLNAKMLFKMYRKNRSDFYKQYLLDATIEQQHSFLPEILERQLVDRSELRKIPFHDRSVVAWFDLASSFSGRRRKSETDYSAGIIAVFQRSTGKMYVVDCFLEHFSGGDEIATAIVKLYLTAVHYGPILGNSIEDSNGSRDLESAINRIARELGAEMMPLNYIAPTNETNAKNVGIALLASSMKQGLVFVLRDVPFVDEIKSQFERWTIDAKRRKDDAVDAIASAWKHYRDLIEVNSVPVMQTDGPVLSWETNPTSEAPNTHADESDADLAWLASFTVPHASA